MYNSTVLDHFQNPRNVGELPNDVDGATAVAEVSNPVCGDILKLWVKVQEGKVAEVSFKVSGCVPSVACGSALTEMIKGRAVSELKIAADEIEERVQGLPAASRHAAQLAADACRAVLEKL